MISEASNDGGFGAGRDLQLCYIFEIIQRLFAGEKFFQQHRLARQQLGAMPRQQARKLVASPASQRPREKLR